MVNRRQTARERAFPPQRSHSPGHTVRNHFSCDLLFKLEAQDTEPVSFFLDCMAGLETGIQRTTRHKRGWFPGSHSVGLFYSQIAYIHTKKAEIHTMHTSYFQHLFPQSANFQIFTFIFSWSNHTVRDTAATTLSPGTSRRAHKHEEEIRMHHTTKTFSRKA